MNTEKTTPVTLRDDGVPTITKAQMIGWLAANLVTDVRGRERREASLERAIAVLGRFVELVGDDAVSLMPALTLDMLFGRSWAIEHAELAADVQTHITTMERKAGRRPTFRPADAATASARCGRAKRGQR
jgi:hypothetical protein